MPSKPIWFGKIMYTSFSRKLSMVSPSSFFLTPCNRKTWQLAHILCLAGMRISIAQRPCTSNSIILPYLADKATTCFPHRVKHQNLHPSLTSAFPVPLWFPSSTKWTGWAATISNASMYSKSSDFCGWGLSSLVSKAAFMDSVIDLCHRSIKKGFRWQMLHIWSRPWS